jgi:hypothetical protein
MSDSLTKEQIEKLALETDPNDGLRVKDIKIGNDRSLHLGFFVKGRPVRINEDETEPVTREVWARSNLTDKDCGDRDRAKLLLESICRFINTGGTWSEINWLLGEARRASQGNILKFGFDGFHLINSAFDTDGACEHLFAKDNCPYIIRWVEGQFMDVVTETALLNEARQAANEEGADAPGTFAGPGSCKGELPGSGDSQSTP